MGAYASPRSPRQKRARLAGRGDCRKVGHVHEIMEQQSGARTAGANFESQEAERMTHTRFLVGQVDERKEEP
jgi:hypothetical protein